MTRATPPRRPWTELPCAPVDLIRFIAAAVRGDSAALTGWLAAQPDGTAVVDVLASRHQLGPYLAGRLRGSAAWAALTPMAQARLERSATLQAHAADGWLAQVHAVKDILSAAGLPFLVLKGGELGIRFGGGATRRSYRDLDILVREADRVAACRAMEAAGFARLSRHFLGARASARFNHAADYARGTDLLDLHWCVSRLPGLRIDTDGFFARAVALGDPAVYVLSPEDELVLLLVSAHADIMRAWLRLQSVVDIALVATALPTGGWGAFFERRLGDGTATSCRAVLHLVASLLEWHDLPGALALELPPQLPAPEALARFGAGQRWAGRRWGMAQLPVNRWRYLCWWGVSLPFRAAASHPRLRRSPG